MVIQTNALTHSPPTQSSQTPRNPTLNFVLLGLEILALQRASRKQRIVIRVVIRVVLLPSAEEPKRRQPNGEHKRPGRRLGAFRPTPLPPPSIDTKQTGYFHHPTVLLVSFAKPCHTIEDIAPTTPMAAQTVAVVTAGRTWVTSLWRHLILTGRHRTGTARMCCVGS